MKHSTHLCALSILTFLLFAAVDIRAQAPKADYQFQNSSDSSVSGAPNIVQSTWWPNSNVFATETVYGESKTVLTSPNGVAIAPITSVLRNNGIYSIGILARFNDLSGYTRVLDFKNGTANTGLYFQDHKLVFYGYGMTGPTVANNNAYVFIVLTRDASGKLTGYVNGLAQFSVDDSTNQFGVIDSNNTLRFFQDNFAGAVARIRVWDQAIPADEVAVSNGGILYAADGAAGNPNCHLYILNPGDGSVTQDIGPIGFAVTGLAFDPQTGILYGATGGFNPSPPRRSMITINPSTGVGTLIGAEGSGGPLADITFTSDATLYGWGEGTDDLYTVNKSTGFATKVAEANFGTAGSGIAANSADILYFGGNHPSGRLATVDRFTGQVTLHAQFSGAPQPSDEFNAFAFDANDVLYASNGGNNEGSSHAHLVTINTTTAVVTDHGSTLPFLDAIAFLIPHCDQNPPVITAPRTVDAVGSKQRPGRPAGATVFFSFSATDPEDGPVTATANPPSGSFFPVGHTSVRVTATDHCGNTGTAFILVTVAAKQKHISGGPVRR